MRFVIVPVLLGLAWPALAPGQAEPAPSQQPPAPQTGAHQHPPRQPDIGVIVPIDPHEHERVHYFGKRQHHLVPGTVVIDRAPYVCDLDSKRFADRDKFTAHLRRAHKASPKEIPDRLIVEDGIVHYVER